MMVDIIFILQTYLLIDLFAHSWFVSEIIHFHTFFIQVISLTTGKMVPSVEKAMERTTNYYF
jgi:hypothetical protein